MNALERKAAIVLAGQAGKGSWSEAALADVLGSLGILSRKQVNTVADKLNQDPDPNHNPDCPSGRHKAKGNVRKAADGRMRCTECETEANRRKREERAKVE